MSDKSAIEWTDATWNPVTGCSKVSPGCANCYAETLSLRYGWSKVPWTPENATENVVLHPERLDQPLRWREPRMVFVNSMADMGHELVPDDFVAEVWARMAAAPRHVFQILSKRPDRMRKLAARLNDPPLANVWIGTSIENDRWAGRADELRATSAAVRFVSAEPLLGPLPSLDLSGIHWLIVGGESAGPPSRSLVNLGPGGFIPRQDRVDWVRDLRDRAAAASVAFFFKQWGGRTPKAGGRDLDGRTWDEMPMPPPTFRTMPSANEPEDRPVRVGAYPLAVGHL